jgi:hypothetical protein
MLLNEMMHSDKISPVQHLNYISIKLAAANIVLYDDLVLAFVRC